jgi:phosphopantothenoylcysteine decarboxylase / phosphopantothenate---cysteine ligase
VSGPVALTPVHSLIELFRVHTALEMLDACLPLFEKCDGAILSAAVADYRPKSPVTHKLKRKAENLTVELEPNPDIAATLGSMKKTSQFLAGFALETENEMSNASQKLIKKNFDFIVLNSMRDRGSGFNGDTNKITIIGKDNKIVHHELKPKNDVAKDIIDYLENIIRK